jgi:branched-chain amino acid transport system substrate-binding protein
LSGEAVALFKRFTDKYKDIKDANEVPFPSYIGNAYDAAHMIALAIKKGGSTEGPKMHAAFESLGSYDGLVKNYNSPFSASRHEALDPDDYSMTVWKRSRLKLIG